MKSFLKLVFGFVLAALTAIMAQLAPMIVPAMLAIIAGFIIIDSVGDDSSKAWSFFLVNSSGF